MPAASAPGRDPAASRRTRLVTHGLLLAAVLAVHGVTVAGDFVYDDLWVVVDNPFVKSPANLARLWTGDLPEGLPDGNRPVVVASYMLDHALFGLDPRGWHLHNVLWHLACALSLAWLARGLTRDEWIPRAAGLLFAVHPVFSEAVAVVSYREDLVATTAMVAAMALVMRARESGGWPPLALACVALLAGTNAKEIVPVFPLLLAAADACFFRGDRRRFFVRCAWTYLPLTLAACGSRFWIDALVSPELLQTAQHARALGPVELLATAGEVQLAYLGQLLLPLQLSADYAQLPRQQPGVASVLGWAASAALLGLAIANARRRPLPAFGLLWFLIGLLPTSGIAPIQNLRADRYLYLPGVGLALAAAWGLVRGSELLARRLPPPVTAGRALAGLLAALCAAYGALAFAHDRVWRDELVLWQHTLDQHPGSLRAQLALMSEYLRRGRVGDAERLARRALSDHPSSWQLQLNLGRVLAERGRPRRALAAFQRAAELGGAGDPELVDNLAIAHLRTGDAETALELLRGGVRRTPGDARMQRHLGQIAFELGDHALAARALENATALEPGDVEAQLLLARSHLRLGAFEAARAAVGRALELAPEHPAARQLAARIERRSARPRRVPPAAAEVSRREIDRLRSLGYADFGDEVVRQGEAAVSEYDPERSAPGYNLVTTRALSLTELLDAGGRVLHEWRDPLSEAWSNAELTPEGELLVQGVRGAERLYLAKLDWQGRVVWRLWLRAHHDVELRPDGRIAALTLSPRPIREVHPELPTLDNGITVLDPQGKVLEQYSLYDMLRARPDVFRFEPVAATEKAVDLLHANSLEFMRHDHLEGRDPIYARGNVLVSFRHQDTVAIFDPAAGEVVWAWGQGEISGPHDATMLENGNVLLFDNGLGRGWSRVVELDPLRREIVWEYRAPRPESFYSASEGSAQRLPNGNTLIGNSVSGEAFEVTRSGDVVWRWRNPNADGEGRRGTIVRIKRHPAAAIEALLQSR